MPTFLSAPDSERNILGAIMTAGAVIYDEVTSRGLRGEDFSTGSTSQVFAAISALQEAGESSDFLDVHRELAKANRLEQIGGDPFLLQLLDGCADTPAGVRWDVNEVRSKARLRRLQATLIASLARVGAGTDDPRKLLGELNENLSLIEAKVSDPTADHVCRCVNQVLAQIEKDVDRAVTGLTTGIDLLDSWTTGIRDGEFWIIGGRAGDGKSTLALQIIAANCGAGIPVHLFSLEMTKRDVLERLCAGLGTVPFPKIRKLRSENHKPVKDGITQIGTNWKLYVTTDSPLTVQDLCAKARVSIRTQGVKLIVADYLQLLSHPAKDERERVTRISGRLRDLAKNTGVPVIALSQLSRPAGGNASERPTKFSLKESGALEADAHTVIAVYRPVDEARHPTGLDELCIVKQRHGPTRDITVRLNVDRMEFEYDPVPRGGQKPAGASPWSRTALTTSKKTIDGIRPCAAAAQGIISTQGTKEF